MHRGTLRGTKVHNEDCFWIHTRATKGSRDGQKTGGGGGQSESQMTTQPYQHCRGGVFDGE